MDELNEYLVAASEIQRSKFNWLAETELQIEEQFHLIS